MRVLPEPDRTSAGRLRWADLRPRILSAAVLAPAALACLWLGGWCWTVLIGLATLGLFAEWLALCRPRAATRAGMALLAAGLCYIGLGAAALLWLRGDGAAGRANVLFLLLIVWASDIGAYVVGRLVGGARLAPAISPGKTWSGAAGGLGAAILAGWLVADGTSGPPAGRAFIVAGALGLVSQAGDLLESAIKRHFGVKDSGHLIPGHGGLLDRLDGVLAGSPAAALLALYVGGGGLLWR